MTTAAPPEVRSLEELLAASAASEAFKNAVRSLEQGRPQDRVAWNPGAPPVKVLRAVSKLLEDEPGLPLERVRVEGRSGCSDFLGRLEAEPGGAFAFEWDCAWRAEGLGWNDAFGLPDQIRAARTFGYQCFKKFERTV